MFWSGHVWTDRYLMYPDKEHVPEIHTFTILYCKTMVCLLIYGKKEMNLYFLLWNKCQCFGVDILDM